MTTSIETTDTTTGWVDDFDLGAPAIEPPRRRRWLRWLAIPLVLVVIVGAAVWVVNPFASTTARLLTAQATTGTVVSSVSVSGSVASSMVEELDFGSSGTVTAVNVGPGDIVSQGQVLATIDDSTLRGQIATAQANLVAAEARLATDKAGPTTATKAAARDSVSQASLQLTTARQNLSDTRAKNAQSINQANAALKSAKATLAADKKTLPPGDPQIAKDQAAVSNAASALSAAKLNATLSLHQAQNQVSSAGLGLTSARHGYALKIVPATVAQLAADKAAVASAQQALSNLQENGATITSPIAGTVTSVNIKVGQDVTGSSGSNAAASSSSSTTGQIEVMDLGQLQVAGQASETDIPKLKMGQPATVSAAALGSNTAVGRVCALGNVGTQISGVTSFPVTVCLDPNTKGLLVGMSGTAAVVTERADGAILVPSLAIKTVGGQQVVTVLGVDGKTQTNVPVTVGISNGSVTQVLSGIAEGQTVVESLSTTTTTRNGGNNRGFPGGGFPGGGGFGG